MILIKHSDIDKIVKKYSDTIYTKFLDKKKSILDVIDILESNKDVDTIKIKGNVKNYTTALKLILKVNKLKKAPHIKDNSEESILRYNLKLNKVSIDKRSKCRKQERFKEINNQLNSIFNTVDLKELFSSKPNNLVQLNSKFTPLVKSDINIYNYFFDYQKYYNDINKLIGQKLGIICCPYCNRNYISYVHNINNKRIIGPTYDHFFHKDMYKFLTLSFYNLIPSCYVCNSNLKHKSKFDIDTHLHPHVDEFGENAVFDFDLNLIKNNNDKKIIFQPHIKPKIDINAQTNLKIFGNDTDVDNVVTGSVKVFKLQEIYKTHYDTVEEIYVKFDQNSPYYIKSIQQILDKLNVTEDEFYRFHFNNYYHSDDFHKRPLSKLTKDIYNKMKQIQNSIN